MTAEFAAGAGARGLIKRTVFAVGDEKQSIFAFQGAAPREYDAALRYFKKQYELSEVAWRVVRFDHSFRSGENMLGAVDEVFRPAAVYRSITSDPGGMLAHQALPHAVPGHVEIWPLIEPELQLAARHGSLGPRRSTRFWRRARAGEARRIRSQ